MVLRERSVPVAADLAGPADALSGKARVWFGLSLALVAANLRPAITSLPPLLPEISHAYRLGPVTSSLLVAIPVLLLGVGSPLAAALARRFGLTRAMDAGLLLISSGVAARSLSVSAMFPGTAVAALGIAVVAVLLPAWIAWRDPLSVGIWTSVYALAMAFGASLAPALTGLLATLGVPLRLSLILWALLPIAALAVQVAVRGGPPSDGPHLAVGMPRSRVFSAPVVALTGFFLLQALLFFSIVTWLPVYVVPRRVRRQRGCDAGDLQWGGHGRCLVRATPRQTGVCASAVGPWSVRLRDGGFRAAGPRRPAVGGRCVPRPRARWSVSLGAGADRVQG